MSWMIGEATEGSESEGRKRRSETEKERDAKSAFALQFGMTLIIWSGPLGERRRLPVTTDVDYTKQSCLEGCVNKKTSPSLLHWVIAGALSSVLIDCNHHSFLANPVLEVQLIPNYLRWNGPTQCSIKITVALFLHLEMDSSFLNVNALSFALPQLVKVFVEATGTN